MGFDDLPFGNEEQNLDDTTLFEPISNANTAVPPKTEPKKEENNLEGLSDPFEVLQPIKKEEKELEEPKQEKVEETPNNIFEQKEEVITTDEQDKTEEIPVLGEEIIKLESNEEPVKKLQNVINTLPIFAFIFVSILGVYVFSVNVKAEQVDLIKIEENTKVGYINNAGEVLAKPKYVSGTEFYKGYAIVKNYNNLSGILNGKAKLEVPFGNYFYVDLYKNRYIVSKFTKEGLKQGLLNSNLEEVTRFNYDNISYSRTGLFLFTRGETMGIMNLNGKEIYTYEVDEVDDRNISIEVSDMTSSKAKYKYARIKVNSSSTIINVETGMEVYKYTLNDIYVLDNNVFYTKTKDGNNKYIVINDDKIAYETSSYKRVRVEDPDSNIAIGIKDDATYDYINLKTKEKINKNENIEYLYSDGVVLVSRHNFNSDKDEYDVVNSDKVVGTFSDIKPVDNTFVNGYSKVYMDENRYNFISKKGKILSNKEYEDVSDFSKNGYAIVSNDDSYGVINESGKEVIRTKYDEIKMFNDDFSSTLKEKAGRELFIFKEDGKYGILDSNGKVVIKPLYNKLEIVSNKYPILKASYNKENILINLKNYNELSMDVTDDINIYENHIVIGKNYYNYDGKLIYTAK